LAEKSVHGSFQIEDFPDREYENLIHIAGDSAIKKGPIISLSSFWASLIEQNSEISKHTLRKLLLFPDTFTNLEFPNIYDNKKYKNKIYAEAALRLKMSPLIIDLKMMCSSKNLHSSQ
jgi:hypothetical protein